MSKVKEHYVYGQVQFGEFNVEEDRKEYIGGSDIPVILGISSFKKRFQLLLEKAGLEDSPFHGNRYTEYGHKIEPIIRDYVNETSGANFIPARIINGDFRYHADGFDPDFGGGTVLEVKSTSEIHPSADDYVVYLYQLIKGMQELNADNGILAVYDRPEDFSLALDPGRLQVFRIHSSEYIPLLNKVDTELEKFRSDLKRLKENPLLTEEDFLPGNTSLAAQAEKVVALERKLASLKEIEAQCKEAKASLYREMMKHNVKSWQTPNGTKVTLVAETPARKKTVTEFNQEAFKAENPSLFQEYLQQVEKTTNGRAGYVKITVPR